MAVSFSKDIASIFYNFSGPMGWRFDLTNYEHVYANAYIIQSRISDPDNPMPPPPFEPLSDDDIQLFGQWIKDGRLP